MNTIAILGYGTVGSGIVKVLNQNRINIEKQAGGPVIVKKVLDKRNFSEELGCIYTQDINEIINDNEIQIIAEVMGGIDPAYEYVKRALLCGKHVLTSNKELVTVHGAELLSIAEERNINFMFEASVGGGIPIVRPLNLALTSDEITAVSGILNGTSNYILTQMCNFGKSYEEALKGAQDLGYAEKDPAADVSGYDACRKLAILLSLATGLQVGYDQILTEGIKNITQADFKFASAFGYNLKHMVDGRISTDGVNAVVAPMLVRFSSPLSAVCDVYNAVMIQAKAAGDIMFYGPGAGKLPTAAAMISDIVDISKHLNRHIVFKWSRENAKILNPENYAARKLVRINTNEQDIPQGVQSLQFIKLNEYPSCAAWITEVETEAETREKLNGIKTESILRIYDTSIKPEVKLL